MRRKRKPGEPKPGIMGSPQSAAHVARDGLKRDGTPMPPTHTAKGFFAPGNHLGGRPKGSYSMDRVIMDELRKVYNKGKRTAGQVIIEKLLEQGSRSPLMRLAIARFVTERMDGKPVQPIRDATPGNRLAHLTDEQVDAILRDAPAEPDPEPDDGAQA